MDGALAAGAPGRRIEGQPFFLPWVTCDLDRTDPDARTWVDATAGIS